jgi:two-component system NtrC family response regulator
LVKVSWFREDLYFRLRGFEIRVPPLRERKEDIPELVLHILSKVARNQHLSREALEVLLSHPWPGNVRELENEVQRAALLTEGTVISAQALSSHLQSGRGSLSPSAAEPPPTLETVKHEAIRKALAFTGGDKKRAAKLLGISRSTLYTMLEEQDPASRG